MLSDDRRREIADFLKTRRMRRQPEELGLPRGRRRRTPGLRREEVAAAAGVSAEWYTWLEQAREVRPSAQVLTRISAALRLEPHETRHLLTLGGYAVPATGSDSLRSVSVSLRLQRLIDQLEYGPAWVFGERWDIVAWNRAASVIHGDLATLQGIERNAHPEAGRLVFDFSVLDVLDERMSSLRLVAYVPAPGTGTREKMEQLLGVREPLLAGSLESV